ncbi:MAG: cobalt-precorrin-5B (C(1))-methyltransferase [Ferrovibrio sp.]|uniref:cobalt-precorrin-5B (C(1))-methyltransferase n=1 Tax=Ferrovibrio sp. TaxID=1917215 RepID=UPI002612690C|nr:cobalt-precorrin-5B (C(1))-methyltransferase [Ferrovibrio sp.]MCW0233931.1 cobalt-precorrin-5B (C(1))-methyltransferase [Ferrovibrio sp.]
MSEVAADTGSDPVASILRRGWTTGACATAGTRAAYQALLTGRFPDPVTITLPKGEQPSFALAIERRGEDERGAWAEAGIVKDAGDDPDVTHQALILARVRRAPAGSGVIFRAGEGVGTVTRPGLPLPPGEPAINPVPRRLMQQAVRDLAGLHNDAGDVEIEISVPGGAELAKQTWNPRLGILGGLSILGTTGIVVPFSCSAWIHSIHRGVDVAVAAGLTHVAGCTGSTSEAAVQALHGLPELALLDMGDFAGALLKYLRQHPVPRLTIGGGFAKLVKLAQGQMDLHSGRSQVDKTVLAQWLGDLGAPDALIAKAAAANTALEVLALAQAAGLPLGDLVAAKARAVAMEIVAPSAIAVDVVAVERTGNVVGRADGAAA